MKHIYEYRSSQNRLIKRLFGVLNWIELVWWAINNRPIIHNVVFRGGIVLPEDNHNLLVLKNKFKGINKADIGFGLIRIADKKEIK